MPAEVETARREWEDEFRRYQAALRDPVQAERLSVQVRLLREELAKRVGTTFTIAQLAAAYRDADAWARHAVADRAAVPGWPRTLSLVEGAAFHLYARGALDYEP